MEAPYFSILDQHKQGPATVLSKYYSKSTEKNHSAVRTIFLICSILISYAIDELKVCLCNSDRLRVLITPHNKQDFV